MQVQVPALPDSDAPDLRRWTAAVVDALGTPDKKTALVTHSLGGVTALHALDSIPGEWRLGALIAVAGFVAPLPVLPQLDSFTTARPDVERTAKRTTVRRVVLSDNDAFVPASHSLTLSETLGADAITVPAAGHFLADDGVTTLPTVVELLLAH